MADDAVYEEVALSDMTYDPAEQLYTYLCPCGDLFEISLEDLHDGEDIAPCPSCTLKIRVLYSFEALPPLAGEEDGPASAAGGAGSTAVAVN
jgi:diphthamide biosynthesis protein 3